MPMAPNPGIESGFKAADQQSYLQQVLANTRATQENAARLKAQSEEMYVDPSVFPGGVGDQMAVDARPDGKLIFKSPTHFAQAKAADDAKNKERIGLDTNEAIANHAVQTMRIGPDHPAWPSIQMAAGRKPLDPLAAKHIEELGRVAFQRAKNAESIDAYGNVIGKNEPTANALPFDPVKAEAEGKEVTEHYDKDGNVTYSLKKTVDNGDSLQSYIKANYGKSQSALTPPELKEARAAWRQEVRSNKGGDVYVTTGAAAQAKQDAPVGKDINQYWLPPSAKFPEGIFASSVPGMSSMSRAQLEQAGAKNTAEWGKPENVVEARNRDKAAFGHLAQLRDFMLDPRNEDLFPSVGKGGLSAIAKARFQQAYNSLADKTDPRLATLDSLDKTSLNLLSGIAPTTGNRLGYQIMVHMAAALSSSFKQPWSREGALASIQGLVAALSASAKSRLPEEMVNATMRHHGFLTDSVTAGLPAAGTGGMPGPKTGTASAGVSGSGWGYKGIKQ